MGKEGFGLSLKSSRHVTFVHRVQIKWAWWCEWRSVLTRKRQTRSSPAILCIKFFLVIHSSTRYNVTRSSCSFTFNRSSISRWVSGWCSSNNKQSVRILWYVARSPVCFTSSFAFSKKLFFKTTIFPICHIIKCNLVAFDYSLASEHSAMENFILWHGKDLIRVFWL